MNAYEEKLQAKKDRFLDAAEKAKERSSQANESGRNISKYIPLGQPILVGHHSEKRHRSDINKLHRLSDKALEESRKAEYYENKADSVGKGGISSDDPEAIVKLREKLVKLEKIQDEFKAINADFRKCKKDISKMTTIKDLTKTTLIETQKKETRGEWGKKNWKPVESWQLSNNSAEMRRINKRIEQLLKEGQRQETKPIKGEIEGIGFEIIEDKEENRIKIKFDGRVPSDFFCLMKSHGWRWSRLNQAFQRHLNRNGRYSAYSLLGIKFEYC